MINDVKRNQIAVYGPFFLKIILISCVNDLQGQQVEKRSFTYLFHYTKHYTVKLLDVCHLIFQQIQTIKKIVKDMSEAVFIFFLSLQILNDN